jgi:hypothetical protein
MRDAAPAAADPQALVDDFIASLGEFGLDREEQEFLGRHFDQVVHDAAAHPGASEPLTRSDWLQAVDVLKRAGAVDEVEGNELVRKLDEAMQPLQKRNVRLALEFSRRYEQDRDQALEWYRGQVAAAEATEAATPPQPAPTPFVPGVDLITSSRSRRLRGPPR